MARIGKHTLKHAKGIADEILRRTVAGVVDRINEFTKIFAEADGGTKSYLRSDLTWSDRTTTRIVSASAFQPFNPASWTNPSGTTDYFQCGAGGARMHIPLPVAVGEKITRIGLAFYRGGANDPTSVIFYGAGLAGSATAQTPTVSWTSPSATTTWEVLYGSYEQEVSQANYYLHVIANNIGDRIRACYVTVEPA